MTETGRYNIDTKRAKAPRASLCVLAAGVTALLLGTAAEAAPAHGGGGAGAGQPMVLDAGSTQFYRQQAVEGRRKHDFSPTSPPRRGKFVYGHWTPYEPPDPATYPPGSKTHVIVKGDTLFDIAGKYYKDNLLWPYIWDANSWVTYPHWIYPGDVLLIPSLMVMPEGKLEEVAELPSIHDAFYAPGGPDFYNCGHFIVDPNAEFIGEIVAAEADPRPIMLTKEDVVYIDVGAKDGALPGDEFAILYPRTVFELNAAETDHSRNRELRHPITGEKLGIVAKMAGRLKIILLGDEVSTARIVYACDAIEEGFELYPFTELPMPLVRKKDRERYFNEMSERGRGYVVWVGDAAVSGSPNHLFSIDIGRNQGIIPGDVFAIYRMVPNDYTSTRDVEHLGRAWDYHWAREREEVRRDDMQKSVYGKQEDVHALPPRLIGRGVVLYSQDNTATAKIIEAHAEFYAGDHIVYEGVDEGVFRAPVIDGAGVSAGVPLNRQPPAIPMGSR